MKAYHITQSDSGVNFYTTDFMDVWNELETTEDRKPVVITPMETTVAEFHELVKNNVNGPESTEKG